MSLKKRFADRIDAKAVIDKNEVTATHTETLEFRPHYGLFREQSKNERKRLRRERKKE